MRFDKSKAGQLSVTDQSTVNRVLSGHSKIDKTKILMTNGSLMKVKRIAECSPWSILQYFWHTLSHNPTWKLIFALFWEWSFKTGFTAWNWISALKTSYRAPDKLLDQLGIYATWLSSIAYLQNQLRIFIFFPHVFLVTNNVRHVFLIEWSHREFACIFIHSHLLPF